MKILLDHLCATGNERRKSLTPISPGVKSQVNTLYYVSRNSASFFEEKTFHSKSEIFNENRPETSKFN